MTETGKKIFYPKAQPGAKPQEGLPPCPDPLLKSELHLIPHTPLVDRAVQLSGIKQPVSLNTGSCSIGPFRITVKEGSIEKLTESLPQAASQLLLIVFEVLANNNNVKAIREGSTDVNSMVVIPLGIYGLLRGRLSPEDIPADTDYDPDHLQKYHEKLKNIAKEVRLSISVFERTTAPWAIDESTGVEMGSYLLHGKGKIKNDQIILMLNDEVSIAILRGPFNKFSPNIMKIPAKDPNAYKMAYALCIRSSNYTNIQYGHEDIISAKSLLKLTDFNELQQGEPPRRAGTTVINPFLNALERLQTRYHVLDSYKLCTKDRKPLTQEELGEVLKDFSKFQDTVYVMFHIEGGPNKEEARKEARAHRGKANRKVLGNHHPRRRRKAAAPDTPAAPAPIPAPMLVDEDEIYSDDDFSSLMNAKKQDDDF